jgi:hypothetical protein
MSLALQVSPIRRDRDELVDEIVSLNGLPDSSHTIEALRFLVTNGYVERDADELGCVSVEPFSTRPMLIQGGLSQRLSDVA